MYVHYNYVIFVFDVIFIVFMCLVLSLKVYKYFI